MVCIRQKKVNKERKKGTKEQSNVAAVRYISDLTIEVLQTITIENASVFVLKDKTMVDREKLKPLF